MEQTMFAAHEIATGPKKSEVLLEVENLQTTVETPKGTARLVTGVSFRLERGRMLGIVGESGSGKSVLGRTIMGLYRNSPGMAVEGSVLFDGVDVQAISERELQKVWGPRIGMVFQDPMTALNPVKKIGAHLTETIRKHARRSRRQAHDRARELLGLVGIPDPARRLGQYPHELSGGMRQRVVIAMALANEPDLLIADEPTTALDVTVQNQILDLLDNLRRRLGMAVILISHNLAVVAGRADDVAVMYSGRFVEYGRAEALFAGRHHPYTEALLGSIPRLHDAPHATLAAIPGSPPDLVSPPTGCRFAPRCRFAQDECFEAPPEERVLPSTGGNSLVACYYPRNVKGIAS